MSADVREFGHGYVHGHVYDHASDHVHLRVSVCYHDHEYDCDHGHVYLPDRENDSGHEF